MAVQHRHLVEGLEQGLCFLGIFGPEIPAIVDLLQRRMGQHHHRHILAHFIEILLEPLTLQLTDHEG